jgi:hypothetical protein
MKTIYNLLLSTFTLFSFSAFSQDEGFIFGKVTTIDNQTYEGPIRWGKEEVYWVDIFNAQKEGNENLKFLSNEDIAKLEERDDDNSFFKIRSYGLCFPGKRGSRNYSSSWNSNAYCHQFALSFGEIKSISPKKRQMAEIELQSGLKFTVNGSGFNDLDADVSVLDKEIGEIAIEWNRIQKVEFKSTPSKLSAKFGEPLIGTVETFQGNFYGAIQWDKEERLSTDKLDGETEDGKVSVAFEKIKSIERFNNRCKVKMNSGKELEISGTNDVNSDNRGILVVDENGNTIEIPWSEFKRVSFEKTGKSIFRKYQDFSNQKEIKALVSGKDGKTQNGKTVIDLDESYNFELFQGKTNDIEYTIPLRNVKKINVLGGGRVEVNLVDGKKLNLRESQDTGDGNQGVLVFGSGAEPFYFSWDDINEIQMQ